MRNLWDKSCRGNQNTHFVFNIFFPPKLCRLWDNVEKYCTVRQATDDNMGACALHAGYLRLQIHTLRLCNTHRFSSTIMVARTRLNVTLYALACLVKMNLLMILVSVHHLFCRYMSLPYPRSVTECNCEVCSLRYFQMIFRIMLMPY